MECDDRTGRGMTGESQATRVILLRNIPGLDAFTGNVCDFQILILVSSPCIKQRSSYVRVRNKELLSQNDGNLCALFIAAPSLFASEGTSDVW